MIEQLITADEALFLWLNGWNHPYMDAIMAVFTHRFTWIPLYILLIVYAWRNSPKPIIAIILLIAAVGLADYVTSGLIKPYVQRLRPCHNPSLQSLIHLVGNCGGKYGFVSSHAANTSALAVAFAGMFPQTRRLGLFLAIWAIIVAYSRIYVGVHFPLDILVGMCIGIILGFISKTIYNQQVKNSN